MVQKILRLDETLSATGYAQSTLYDKVAKGEFPKPIKLGVRAVGWLENEVADWQKSRIAARDQEAA